MPPNSKRKYEGKLESYRRTYKKYGVNARSLQYPSSKAQAKRFRELVTDIDFENRSVLDIGCGFGDIIPFILSMRKTNLFIEAKTRNVDYTGVDIVPEFIEVCRQKYPKYNFVIVDYFRNPLKKKFDIIITSGALNANIKNPYTYRKKAIKVMWEHSNEIVAFNMAGGNPQPQNKKGNRVYYANLNKIVDFCKTLTTNIIIRKAYSPKDFTIIIYK